VVPALVLALVPATTEGTAVQRPAVVMAAKVETTNMDPAPVAGPEVVIRMGYLGVVDKADKVDKVDKVGKVDKVVDRAVDKVVERQEVMVATMTATEDLEVKLAAWAAAWAAAWEAEGKEATPDKTIPMVDPGIRQAKVKMTPMDPEIRQAKVKMTPTVLEGELVVAAWAVEQAEWEAEVDRMIRTGTLLDSSTEESMGLDSLGLRSCGCGLRNVSYEDDRWS